jgi:hypothetical protein
MFLATEIILMLSALIFLAAILYSSVGHAGASGYLAAMALLGVAPGVMKPTALTLNILVALIATVKFYRAGCFSWPLFWPFAVASIPLAYLGGSLSLPGTLYKQIVGLILLCSAYQLVRTAHTTVSTESAAISLPFALSAGAGIGLLSGLTGTGGGIFLSPLLLFTGWAETKQSSGVSAAFILVNSIAGLLGVFSQAFLLPPAIPLWATAAVAGGLLGAEYGSRRLATPTLRRLLAVVLVIAGGKLIATV